MDLIELLQIKTLKQAKEAQNEGEKMKQKIEELETKIADQESKLNSLLNHTHSYQDTTISDTADGTGGASSSTRATSTPINRGELMDGL